MSPEAKNKSRLLSYVRQESLLFLLSFIFAFSFGQLCIEIMHLPMTIGTQLLLTLPTLLVLSIAFLGSTSSLISVGLILLGFIALFIANWREAQWLEDFKELVIKHSNVFAGIWKRFIEEGYAFFYTELKGQEAETYALFAKIVIITIVILSFLIIQKAKLYWPLLFLSILSIPIAINSGANWAMLWLIPMALVSIAMILYSSGEMLDLLYKKSGMKHILSASTQLLVVLVLAVVLAIVGSGVLNYQKLYSPYWQGILDDFSTRLPDSLQADLSISPFSIGDDGFYPLGAQLGGSMKQKDEAVAKVEGIVPSLLKVQSSDYYNGQRWQRLVNNPNYRFASPFNAEVESEIFNPRGDENFLSYLNLIPEKLYKDYEYSLLPLRGGSQLLFLSGTPTNLVSSREEALLFYFNQAGTVYARASFNNKHSYKVEAYDISSSSLGLSEETSGLVTPAQLDEALKKYTAAGFSLANKNNAYKNYLQVPDTDPYKKAGKVQALAEQLTKGIKGNYQKTSAILKYFTENPEFSYNLTVENPPSGQDFVEHFLESKVGYCTYYATAATMLLRSAGIPARFVEGYGLTAENIQQMNLGKEVLLNSINAHAWTEVYLDGIGWIAIDPTPGGVAGLQNDQNGEDPTTTTTTSTPPPEDPEITTTTTNLSETTSSSIDSTVPTTTQEDNDKKDSNLSKILLTLLIILLVIAAIVAAIYFYIKKRKEYLANIHNREWMKEKYPSPNERALFYWKEIQKLAKIGHGYIAPPSATELQIARELEALEENVDSAKNRQIGETVAEASYRNQELDEEKVELLAEQFDQREEKLKTSLGDLAYLRKRILIP